MCKNWKIEIGGKIEQLKWLHENVDNIIFEEKNKYYYSIPECDKVQYYEVASTRSRQVVNVLKKMINVKMKTEANIDINSIAEYEGEKLLKRIVPTGDINILVRSRIDANVSGGKITNNLEGLFNFLESKSDSSIRYSKAIDFFLEKNWVGYYKVYELAKDDGVLNSIENDLNNRIKRFKMTANNIKLSGDSGRHASRFIEGNNKNLSSNPMTFAESESLICEILNIWYEERKNVI